MKAAKEFRMSRFATVLIFVLASPALVAAQEDARCGAQLRRAWDLTSVVAGRDRGGPYAPEAICGVLRANLRDMAESTEIMKRCMAGHSLRENVGQMEASMEDVRAVIAGRCR